MKFFNSFIPATIASLFLAAAFVSHAQESNFQGAQKSIQEDLKAALSELSALRSQISEEKIPLTQKRNRLENEVLAKRKELEAAERSRDNQLVDLNVLKSEVKAREEEMKYLGGFLSEYGSLFETRIHISETGAHQPRIDAALAAAENQDLNAIQRLRPQIELLREGLDRIAKLAGGVRFEGSALTPRGALEKGRFALVGPIAVFSSSESGAAGISDLKIGSPEPSVIPLEDKYNQDIRALVESGEGMLAVDATQGNALKISQTKDTLIAHLIKGGPVMIPLLGLGVLALIVALLKWAQLSRIVVVHPTQLQVILNHLHANRQDEAVKSARTIQGIVGEMLVQAVEHCHEKKEYIEEVMYEKMISTKPVLERYLPIIALTAATAPLLGLLGTVTGMINTFNMITVFGTGDPRMLSGGISEALITTKFGLVVAVPALLLHALVSRKAKGILSGMEQTAVGFINGIPPKREREKLYV